MKKEHNIIKFFMPVIAIAYCLLMAFLAAKLLKSKEFVLTENLLFTAVRLVEAFLTVFICSKIMPKLFSNCDSYKAKIPKFSIVIALLLIAPFILILEYDFIYFIRGLITKEAVEKIPFVEKTDSAYVTLIESISAVFFAPIIEELTFRYMAISPFKKKKSKIIAFLFTTLVFGIIHVSNFFAVAIDATILGLVFLGTKNIVYCILMHAFGNLSKTVFFLLAFYGISDINYCQMPIILFVDKQTKIFGGILFLIGLTIILFSKKKRNS